jgi:hypothetical protein
MIRYIGGSIVDGKEYLIFINDTTHEISEVEKDKHFDLSKAL